MDKVPLCALSLSTRRLLSSLLNPKKLIPSDNNYLRDWRGLADLAAVRIPDSSNPTDNIIDAWELSVNGDPPPTVGKLLHFLGLIDRWDVFDDVKRNIENDAVVYLHGMKISLPPSTNLNLKDKILVDKSLQQDIARLHPYYNHSKPCATLDTIPSWTEYFKLNKNRLLTQACPYMVHLLRESYEKGRRGSLSVNSYLNSIVCIWKGDISALNADAIVNSANKTLLGGGGADGAIHLRAGPSLREECATLNGCATGDAKITKGYRLPAKYVIHTVGPVGEKPKLLKKCYRNCLNIALKKKLDTIAFPCISTGFYDYPQSAAAVVALCTVRKFLEINPQAIKKIVFCLFQPQDVTTYEILLQVFFPTEKPNSMVYSVRQDGDFFYL